MIEKNHTNNKEIRFFLDVTNIFLWSPLIPRVIRRGIFVIGKETPLAAPTERKERPS